MRAKRIFKVEKVSWTHLEKNLNDNTQNDWDIYKFFPLIDGNGVRIIYEKMIVEDEI